MIMATARKKTTVIDDGRRQNSGRPPLSPDGSVTMNIRMTPAQRAKLDALGGAQWIRERIDRAKEPVEA